MPWTRPFPAPIVLRDGRTLATLADARGFIRTLTKHRRRAEQWQYAEGLLLEAATGRGAMGETNSHLLEALKVEGLI
jgi:transposase